MRQCRSTMNLRLAWLLSTLLAVSVAARETSQARFSQTLSAAELVEAGVNRLSSDQVAVLDALVRRDLAAQLNPRRGDPVPAARFSQRLTDDERRNAGLALLTEAELKQLDTFANRNASAVLAHTLLAPPVFLSPGVRLRPDGEKTGPEVHGTMSFMYSWSKGGYSEKTGAMQVRFADPVRGYSLDVGYSETHAKGPFPYYYRDGAGLPAPPLAP